MSKLPTQSRSEDSHRSLENFSIGKSLILNSVKSADIEGFLAECEGQSLVKALARMKKEVYSCQSALQQQQQEQQQKPNVVKGKNEVQAEEKDGVEQQIMVTYGAILCSTDTQVGHSRFYTRVLGFQ